VTADLRIRIWIEDDELHVPPHVAAVIVEVLRAFDREVKSGRDRKSGPA
jgi:hypothetical protein